jgi:hypothetical protein
MACELKLGDARSICADVIDVAVMDARGRFEMPLDPEYLEELLSQRVPEIAFRIFDNGKPVAQTQRIIWRVAAQATRLQTPLATAADPGIARNVPAQSVKALSPA